MLSFGGSVAEHIAHDYYTHDLFLLGTSNGGKRHAMHSLIIPTKAPVPMLNASLTCLQDLFDRREGLRNISTKPGEKVLSQGRNTYSGIVQSNEHVIIVRSALKRPQLQITPPLNLGRDIVELVFLSRQLVVDHKVALFLERDFVWPLVFRKLDLPLHRLVEHVSLPNETRLGQEARLLETNGLLGNVR